MLIVGFDLETTGLLDEAGLHRIIEIALVVYDENGVKKGSFVRRFNPGRPIDPKAQEVHGITFEQVAHLPALEDDHQGIELIQKIMSKCDAVVAHNGKGFDKPFLEREFARIGKELHMPPMIDTMTESRWATPYGKNPNLGELCFACRVDYDPAKAHSAEYDVERMMECFFFANDRGLFSLPETKTEKEVETV